MRTIAFVYIFEYGTYPILYEYCNQLARLNFQVYYIGLSDTSESFLDSNGVNVIHLDKNKITYPVGFAKSAKDLLISINPELVHVFHYRWCLLLPLMSLFRYQWLLDLRTVHVGDKDGHYSRFTFLKNRLTWFESLFYDQSIALTKKIKALLSPSRKPVPVIPLGANISKFYPTDREKERQIIRMSFSLEPDDKVFLYSGTLNPNRKLEAVFTAFAQLLRQHKNSFLFILGHDKDNTATLENYRVLCKQLGISAHVHFTGYLPYHQVIKYYNASDIGLSFVPLTPYFNFQPPTKLFEYMAAQLIVISTRSNATLDVIEHGYNGFLTDDTPEGLSQAMVTACALEEEEKQSILRHAQTTAATFDWEHLISTRLLPVYNKMLKQI